MDLTQYMPAPFTVEYGRYKLTSPVPTVKAGKLIKALTDYQVEAAQAAEKGDTIPTPPDQLNLTDDQAGRLIFGDTEWARVETENMPSLFAQYAIIAAQAYWAAGGSAQTAAAILDAITGTTGTGPKGQPNPEPSKNGQPTGKATPSDSENTANPSTRTTGRQQRRKHPAKNK